MSKVYLAIIFFTALLLILSLSKAKLRLRYQRKGKDDEFAVEFSLWRGLLRSKFEVPVVKIKKSGLRPESRPESRRLVQRVLRPAFKIRAQLEGEGGRPIIEVKKGIHVPGPARMLAILSGQIRYYRRYKPALYYLLGRISLRRLHWSTELGTGDPAQTGVLTGALWGLKGFLLSFLYAIRPCFEKTCLNTNIDCILEVRLGYLFFTGIKAIFLRIRA